MARIVFVAYTFHGTHHLGCTDLIGRIYLIVRTGCVQQCSRWGLEKVIGYVRQVKVRMYPTYLTIGSNPRQPPTTKETGRLSTFLYRRSEVG